MGWSTFAQMKEYSSKDMKIGNKKVGHIIWWFWKVFANGIYNTPEALT